MTLTSPLSPWAKMRSIPVSWILVLASCLVIQYGFLNDSFENVYPRWSSHACSSVMPDPPDSDRLLSSSWSAFHVVSRLICVSPLFSSLFSHNSLGKCLSSNMTCKLKRLLQKQRQERCETQRATAPTC